MSAKGTDATNASTGQGWGNTYNTQGNQTLSQVSPFLQNELNNPTGFGASTVNQMKTQGGEAAAGAVGGATEAANLNASRTGNTAAVPGIIDAASRAGQQGETTAANNVDIQNSMLKNQQQQAAAGGLESLYGTQTANALKSLGLSNEAAQNEQTAQQGNFQDVMSVVNQAASPGPLAAFGV